LFACPEPSSDVGITKTFSLHQERKYLVASHLYMISGSFGGEMRISFLGHGREKQRLMELESTSLPHVFGLYMTSFTYRGIAHTFDLKISNLCASPYFPL
jgi:hypothetical protein